MIEALEILIARKKFDEFILKILSISQSKEATEMRRSIRHLEGRLNELNRLNMEGVITYQDGTVTLNEIRKAFFDFIDIYDDEIKRFSAPPPPKIPTYADFDPILSELAHELAVNYFVVSFGNEPNRGHHRPDWKAIFETTAHFGQPITKKRNILIVGAGATYAACPYLPYGRQLRDYLLDIDSKRYKEGDDAYHQLYPMFDIEAYLSEVGLETEERASLEAHLKQIQDKQFNIENYLSVLDSKLDKEDKPKLRADLQQIYNKRHLPTHTYEIIAHLFKHRFIDIIINFNFDELLDQAIEEELGKSDYHKILHEGDCEPLSNIMIDGRLKTPIYIKIHGTASIVTSMKFTQNHRLELPEQMKQFIRNWITGQVNEHQKDNIPVNLITVGFDLERAQFSDELKALPEGSKLFQINWKKDSAARVKHLKTYYEQANGEKRHLKLADWDKINDKERDTQLVPMADFWTRLWQKMVDLFKPLFKPRSIARHQIVVDIFYHGFKCESHRFYKADLSALKAANKRFNRYFSSSAYFFERTVVEIAITLANNKGLIEPSEAIKQDRIGTFYDKYKKKLYADLERIKYLNNQRILTPNEQAERKGFSTKPYCIKLYTLKKIYTDCFKMEEKFSFSNHLFNLSTFPKDGEADVINDFLNYLPFIKAPVSLDDSNNLHLLLTFRLYQAIIKGQLYSTMNRVYGNKEAYLFPRLCKALDEIRQGFSYNITPKFTDHTVYAFESVRRRDILHTNLALSYQFETVFSAPNQWDALLLISERGNFLAKHIRNLAADKVADIKLKPIIIIGCHEAIAADLHQPKWYDTTPKNINVLSKIYLEAKNLKAYDKIKLHFLPYWRHHHHIAIFLKVKNQALNLNKAHFELKTTHLKVKNQAQLNPPLFASHLEVVQSIYYFKQGFSNKINPLLVPTEAIEDTLIDAVKADQKALMDKFIAHYMKAVYFGVTGNAIAVVKPDLSFKYEKSLRDEHYTETKDDFFKYLVSLCPKNLS